MITNKPNQQEQIRLLRSKLIHQEHVPERLLMTSTRGGEGKTTVASALGASLAAINCKTIVVHADLRERKEEAEMAHEKGLSDFLSGKLSKDQLIKQGEVGSNDVIHAGTATPFSTELLEGGAFHDLMEELKEAYDMVIVDGPPVIQVSDSIPLMAICDAAVLAVEHQKTREDEVLDVSKQLQNYDVKVLGAVMTKVKSF
ncbi:CpsD/CapB family tyrosine-protein kinase [Salisediminibacterium beveridgei]|uniref:Capsular polysaccharide biosynthesis protein n=1 Tax=Salisediminibacterium beveridgei TaxID=632773 RepID=A0A1D7QRN7_9BACI|nr:CpsD/CapB family tyrosine-protein kinase [Salisediminibacterium beveridgei]AOM81678.1 capsular polysaccharide biosynthesis protein [Salisediminibacterium beveridgei]